MKATKILRILRLHTCADRFLVDAIIRKNNNPRKHA
tara:strand:- start:1494 stop:1601 length:108 start_codon:yes stop_codon:yes gene_type:complete